MVKCFFKPNSVAKDLSQTLHLNSEIGSSFFKFLCIWLLCILRPFSVGNYTSQLLHLNSKIGSFFFKFLLVAKFPFVTCKRKKKEVFENIVKNKKNLPSTLWSAFGLSKILKIVLGFWGVLQVFSESKIFGKNLWSFIWKWPKNIIHNTYWLVPKAVNWYFKFHTTWFTLTFKARNRCQDCMSSPP